MRMNIFFILARYTTNKTCRLLTTDTMLLNDMRYNQTYTQMSVVPLKKCPSELRSDVLTPMVRV